MTEIHRRTGLAPRFFFRPLLTAVMVASVSLSPAAFAQQPPPPAPLANVVNLSATGEREAPQDFLTLSLRVTKEGANAADVQRELKQVLEKALAQAQAAAKPGLMDVRTGQFSLYPRHGKDGKISAWQGTAELLLEGQDLALVSATAGRLPGMAISQASFSLSRQARQRLEKEVQALAIERFKAQAGDLAKGFGFEGYTLREVSVNGSGDSPMPVHGRMMAMEASSMADSSPIPVAAGNSTVSVTVSGSIVLR
jgi:predicted secreted protein